MTAARSIISQLNDHTDLMLRPDGTLAHVYVLTVDSGSWHRTREYDEEPQTVGVFASLGGAAAEAQKRHATEVARWIDSVGDQLRRDPSERALVWNTEGQEQPIPTWWASGYCGETLYTIAEYPVSGDGVLDQVANV